MCKKDDNQQSLFECLEEYENKNQVIGLIDEFYKKLFEGALEIDWYCKQMLPFYEDDAIKKLASYLHQVL